MKSPDAEAAPRPAEVCRQLLASLDASEGRRRRRARNTTSDAIGLAVKRRLLEEAIRDDPAPDAFEAWLLERCLAADAGSGAVRAMARSLLEEWRLALACGSFQEWLARGAPSDDAAP